MTAEKTGKPGSVRLLITGKMGSGKGYCADYISEKFNAQRWSRTELMKLLSHSVADQVGDPDAVLQRIFPDAGLRDEVRAELISYAAGYVSEPGKPRRLYQDVTEICQQHDPLCFERELADRIEKVGECDFFLIDDVRSAAAFDYFTARGYRSLRIEAPEEVRRSRMLARDGYLPSEETFNHPSEIELDTVEHDFTVDNDGADLDAFYAELDRIMLSLKAAV